MPPRPGRCKDINCACTGYKKRYDSLAEAARGAELELLEQAGQIRELRRQVPFDLHAPGGGIVGVYIADWTYTDAATGVFTVEDCKGHRTPIYQRSKRHLLAEYGIAIRET